MNSLSSFSKHVLSPLWSKVVPHVVHLVQTIRTDGLSTSKAFLLQFTELIHCMMYQYSGFPDLYDNILEAIKVNTNTTEQTMSILTLFTVKCFSRCIYARQPRVVFVFDVVV